MTSEESTEHKKEMKRKKLWWEIWLDRLKVMSFAAIFGAASTVMWKAWDAAEMFKTAHAQVKVHNEDIALINGKMSALDAGFTKEMKQLREEFQRNREEDKKDTDRKLEKLMDLQIQTLKEIRKR